MLGWPVNAIKLRYNNLYAIPNWLLGASLRSVAAPARTELASPWPDLVIAIGRRSVAPARWIRAQSGGRSKLVQLGRPRAPLSLFDLVVTTPQYGLPPADNLVQLPLPLTSAAPIAEDVLEVQRARLAALPRPWTAVLVGGSAWPYRFDAAAARSLSKDLNQWAEKFGGGLILFAGPRTGPDVEAGITSQLAVPHILHRWPPDDTSAYTSVLQIADRIIATGDSVSQLADACHAKKPTAIWQPPERGDPITRIGLAIGNRTTQPGLASTSLRGLAKAGILSPPRSVSRVHERLVALDMARWFEPTEDIEKTDGAAIGKETDDLVNRIRALAGS
jgi:mitochondrial fission protein ELM1